MKNLGLGLLLLTTLSGKLVNAVSFLCFTANKPALNPNVRFVEDREIYFTCDDGGCRMDIWRSGEKQSQNACARDEEFMGFKAKYNCGDEVIYLDVPNNKGVIVKLPDGDFNEQDMICRDVAHVQAMAVSK